MFVLVLSGIGVHNVQSGTNQAANVFFVITRVVFHVLLQCRHGVRVQSHMRFVQLLR